MTLAWYTHRMQELCWFNQDPLWPSSTWVVMQRVSLGGRSFSQTSCVIDTHSQTDSMCPLGPQRPCSDINMHLSLLHQKWTLSVHTCHENKSPCASVWPLVIGSHHASLYANKHVCCYVEPVRLWQTGPCQCVWEPGRRRKVHCSTDSCGDLYVELFDRVKCFATVWNCAGTNKAG